MDQTDNSDKPAPQPEPPAYCPHCRTTDGTHWITCEIGGINAKPSERGADARDEAAEAFARENYPACDEGAVPAVQAVIRGSFCAGWDAALEWRGKQK